MFCELAIIGEETILFFSIYYINISAKRLRKIKENRSQDGQCFGRDSN
jgi:hypothetical protein